VGGILIGPKTLKKLTRRLVVLLVHLKKRAFSLKNLATLQQLFLKDVQHHEHLSILGSFQVEVMVETEMKKSGLPVHVVKARDFALEKEAWCKSWALSERRQVAYDLSPLLFVVACAYTAEGVLSKIARDNKHQRQAPA
jgi:hypothetical protein